MLRLLISKGTKMNINSESGTPLYVVKKESVKILLDKGLHVRQTSEICVVILLDGLH
jgi:hypothetical protein